MKIMPLIIGTLALLGVAMLYPEAQPHGRPSDGPVLLPVGRAEPYAVAVRPTPSAQRLVESLSVPDLLPTAGNAPDDAAALATLFGAQPRDPMWAPGAEALIRDYTTSGSTASCAQFMCRVRMPLAGPVDAAAADTGVADDQAIEATRNWPPEVSYNRYTADIRHDDKGAAILTFYVTRQ